MSLTAGSKAARAGKSFEDKFAKRLIQLGYVEIQNPFEKEEFLQGRPWKLSRWYLRQAIIGETIFGRTRFVDFFVGGKAFPAGIVVECRWQKSPGTVEDKVTTLLENIKLSERPTILLLDGGGAGKGVISYLKKQLGQNQYLEAIYSWNELEKAIEKGLFKKPSSSIILKTLELS